MDDVWITILSLVGGAVLASITGIGVTIIIDTIRDRKKKEEENNAFKLVFKLYINKLYSRLCEFEDALTSHDHSALETFIKTHLIDDNIFYNYREIAELPKMDIHVYFDMIEKLQEIDKAMDKPIDYVREFRTGNIVGASPNNNAKKKLEMFIENDMDYLRELKESLDS